MMPFKGDLRYNTSLQKHANYFCTFQLRGTELVFRERGGVLFHPVAFLFTRMSPVAYIFTYSRAENLSTG